MERLCVFFGLCIVGLVWSSCALKAQTESKLSPEIDPSFNGLLPIEWMHVPKAGTSFINTLVNIPGMCPGLPKNVCTDSWEIFKYHPETNCDLSALNAHRITSSGLEALDGYNAGKGRFVTFLRQPEQRILSQLLFATGNGEMPPTFNFDTPMGNHHENLLLYASGFVTKMLVRGGVQDHWLDPSSGQVGINAVIPWQTTGFPTPAEVEEAKIRLRTGFSFIGLTEQWELSICLFNTMFNQECHACQFRNTRPTPGHEKTKAYDMADLRGYQDPYDHDLWDIGVAHFAANLKKYNVSESSCQPCYREAGLIT